MKPKICRRNPNNYCFGDCSLICENKNSPSEEQLEEINNKLEEQGKALDDFLTKPKEFRLGTYVKRRKIKFKR